MIAQTRAPIIRSMSTAPQPEGRSGRGTRDGRGCERDTHECSRSGARDDARDEPSDLERVAAQLSELRVAVSHPELVQTLVEMVLPTWRARLPPAAWRRVRRRVAKEVNEVADVLAWTRATVHEVATHDRPVTIVDLCSG